jgi:hypothetical protein
MSLIKIQTGAGEVELPCFDNAQRLARLETKCDNILSSIASLKKCENCKSAPDLAKVKQNLRIVNYVGSLLTTGIVGWFLKTVLYK